MQTIIKNILIVVDMQNDFVFGQFATKQAQKIVPKIAQEIADKSYLFDRIIFTRDVHTSSEFVDSSAYPNQITYEGKWFSRHCRDSFAESEIVYPLKDFAEFSNSTVITKNCFDGSARIIDYLEEKYKIDLPNIKFNFYIAGVCTDICVLATAIGLSNYAKANIIDILANKCAGTSPKAHRTALAAAKSYKILIDRG